MPYPSICGDQGEKQQEREQWGIQKDCGSEANKELTHAKWQI